MLLSHTEKTQEPKWRKTKTELLILEIRRHISRAFHHPPRSRNSAH
jgi:hypothetical protein